MYINPMKAIAEGWIKPHKDAPPIVVDVDDPNCQIQQNGIDLRLAICHNITHGGRIGLKEKAPPMTYQEFDENGMIALEGGKSYAFDTMEHVHLPDGVAAFIKQRSSLNRGGCTIQSGLWDTGFKGCIGGTFYPSVPIDLEIGVRVCQIVFVEAEAYRKYEGQYKDHELSEKK